MDTFRILKCQLLSKLWQLSEWPFWGRLRILLKYKSSMCQRMTNQDIKNFWVQDHQGGSVFYLDAPAPPPQHPSTTSDTFGGAIPQAPERLVGQSRGRPVRHWMEPVGGGQSVKFHCLQWWQATLEPSGAGGAAKEGESGARGKGRWGRVRMIR